MRRRNLLALLAVTPLLAPAALALLFQEPGRGAQEDAEPTPDPSDAVRVEWERKLERMAGAWSLAEVRDEEQEATGLRQRGVMLITEDGFLSIELHLGRVEGEAEILTDTYFQSGTHRIEVNDAGRMVLQSLIGAQTDIDGYLLFEEPGRLRTYGVDVTDTELVLERVDREAGLVFRRVPPARRERDIFGRPVEPAEEEAREDEDEDEDEQR